MTDVQNLVNMVLGASGIQYLSIDELFNLRNGYTPSKSEPKFWTDGTIPWFVMDDIRQNGTILSDSIQHITPSAVKGNLFPADSIIVSTSATIGSHALIKVPFLCNQRFTCLMLKDKYNGLVDMKYIYYYMDKVDEWCKDNTYQSSFQTVDMDGFRNIPIPIPSLEVQHAIVTMLDHMCNLQVCLINQCVCRTNQFEYYLREFTTNPCIVSGVCQSGMDFHISHYTLGECIEKNIGGGTPSKSKKEYWTDGTIPWASVADVTNANFEISETEDCITERALEGSNSNIVSPNMVIVVTRVRPGVMVIPTRDIAINQDMRGLVLKPFLIPKYLVYYSRILDVVANGSIVKGITIDQLNAIPIDIPPVDVQKRIVEILDEMFDSIVTLRNEIEARSIQFEYYRNLIFAFRGDTA